MQIKTLAALAALSLGSVHAIQLDPHSVDSIKSAAKIIASGLAANYHGTDSGHVVGTLDGPYYWWNSGAFWDTLIQYFHLTGDDQYNNIVSQALVAQKGQNSDFMPANQTKSEGNDDQDTWAAAALSAAEFSLPEQDKISWISLAENVFNEQVLRWDDKTCDGGLRWQIFPFLTGYDYKNSISNGDFFRLSSRLARYTGNSTYSDWASKVFNWTTSVGLVDSDWNVFDGAHVSTNCTDINKVQFSYYAGTFINGAANMYNISTGDSQSQWKVALDGLLKQTFKVFFPSGIATEIACETRGTCTLDMKSFKGLLAQALVGTIQVAPYTSNTILTVLQSSAQAAANACEGAICGFVWSTTEAPTIRSAQDGNETSTEGGLGNQLSALSFVQALLVAEASGPVTGGGNATSTGGSGGGSGGASGTQTGTPTSTNSGTGSPSPTGNAGNSIGAERVRVWLAAGVLGSLAWLIL